MFAALVVPLSGTALASHVGTVTITPPVGIEATGVCSPFLVTTSGGTDSVGARVDVEVIGTSPIQFCLPAAGLNPVLIDPATGDLGPGPVEVDGDIGGEAVTRAAVALGLGSFTFGIESAATGTADITAFVEEGVGNDDPDPGEPTDSASQIFVLGDGGGGSPEVPGATTQVTSLDCVPENASNPSGSAHNFFCYATGAGGAAITGAEVNFDVTGGPNAARVGPTACSFTDANGVAQCEYRDGGGSPSGTDSITAYTGPSLASSLNRDQVRNTFTSGGSVVKRLKSRVSIAKRFKGKVRSRAGKCESRRKVVLKKVRKGPDRRIGRDRTNKRGGYRIAKPGTKGRVYAVAKRKKLPTKICKKARSRTVRRR